MKTKIYCISLTDFSDKGVLKWFWRTDSFCKATRYGFSVIPLTSSSIEVEEITLKSVSRKEQFYELEEKHRVGATSPVRVKVESLRCNFGSQQDGVFREETIPATGLEGELYITTQGRLFHKLQSDEGYFPGKLRGIAAIFHWIASPTIRRNKARSQIAA